MTSTFREAAEKRIAELEARERERTILHERRAAEALARQTEQRQAREAARQAAAEQAAAEQRAQLARDHGQQTAERVRLGASYWCFVAESRGVAVAITRPAGATSRDNWRATQRVQAGLNVGVGTPTILVGEQLAEHAEGLRLLIDPSDHELSLKAGPA